MAWLSVAGERALLCDDTLDAEKHFRCMIAEWKLRRRNTTGEPSPVVRSFAELHTATPAELAKMLLEDGLLQNLQGAPCFHPRCIDFAGDGLPEDRTLGRLRGTNGDLHLNIEFSNVFYRCITCRAIAAINRGSTIYRPVAGSCAVTQRTLAFWNMVNGADIVLTSEQLGLTISRVTSFYSLARAVCAQDAVRREQNVEFGARDVLTTDNEAGKWTLCTWVEGRRHYSLVWLGILQRGNPSKMLLRPCISSDQSMFPGVIYTEQAGEIPHLKPMCVDSVFRDKLSATTHAILMIDSSSFFQGMAEGTPGICETYVVNRSQGEYERPEQA